MEQPPNGNNRDVRGDGNGEYSQLRKVAEGSGEALWYKKELNWGCGGDIDESDDVSRTPGHETCVGGGLAGTIVNEASDEHGRYGNAETRRQKAQMRRSDQLIKRSPQRRRCRWARIAPYSVIHVIQIHARKTRANSVRCA